MRTMIPNNNKSKLSSVRCINYYVYPPLFVAVKVLIVYTFSFVIIFVTSGDYQNGFVSAEVVRRKNLDYFDVETVKYYLLYYSTTSTTSSAPFLSSQQPSHTNNYNVVVMFYAPWCDNCHALAPTYDSIATMLNAGYMKKKNSNNNIIMALFNCEETIQHSQTCDAVGIKHYPSIVYFDLSLPKSNNSMKQKHVHIFNGNWQYGGSIYDWIRVMSTMSTYQRSTFREHVYNWYHQVVWFAGGGKNTNRHNHGSSGKSSTNRPVTGNSNMALPIGIPSPSTTTTTDDIASTTANINNKNKNNLKSRATIDNDNTIEQLLLEKYDKAQTLIKRSSIIIEAMLFPIQMKSLSTTTTTTNYNNKENDTTKEFTDVYTYMNHSGTWNVLYDNKNSSSNTSSTKYNYPDMAMISCVSDVALDYCNRLNSKFMYEWIDRNYNNSNITDTISNEVYEQYETELYQYINTYEPYCFMLDSCINNSFMDHFINGSATTASIPTVCKPNHCPFHDEVACRYLTICLAEDIISEYDEAVTKLLSHSSSSTENSNNLNNDKNRESYTTSETVAGRTTTATKKANTKVSNDRDDNTNKNNHIEEQQSSTNTGTWGLKKKR